MRTSRRVTANDQGRSLTINAGTITASVESRTLAGTLVRYGVPGRTSAGQLRVRPGAIVVPEPVNRVVLTREHDRSTSRGTARSVELLADGIRASVRVADGPEGDDALREADPQNPVRGSFSYDVINARIEGDELVYGELIAIGQVAIGAYADSRIDTVAASQTPGTSPGTTPNRGDSMTPEQRARLAALRAQGTRTAEEETELTQLAALENPPAPAAADPAPTPAAAAPAAANAPPASAPQPAAAPAGVPVSASHTQPATTAPRGGHLGAFAELVARSLQPGGRSAEVTAALADVTHADFTAEVSQESWSGELWSGLEYTPQFMNLFNTGPLTSWAGKGWRWVTKPRVGDYAGNKTEIPTNVVSTEPSNYEAFRLAGGWDIDRKFFDFPDTAFIASFLAAAREDYFYKLDMKVRDYTLANAVVPTTTPATPTQNSLLKAARIAAKHVKKNTRAAATAILVNDDDLDSLFDIAELDLPAYLKLLGVDPENWIASEDVPEGTVIGLVKQTATVRQLPGASPLRVELQNLTKAGIDEAIFGYGAIEEHHAKGIVKVAFDPEAV